MKKTILLLLAVSLLSISFGASTPVPGKGKNLKASEILIPIGNTGQLISMWDLSRISVKDVQKLTGRKMSVADKIGFRIAQHKLRSNINPDGTVNSKQMQKRMKKMADVTDGFHIGGFALGFFLTIIGVLIAYLINDDKKAVRVKWAWIGFAVSLVLWLLLVI